jgi:hypothetical protein
VITDKGGIMGLFGARRLAADCFAVDWGVNLRILLGDVWNYYSWPKWVYHTPGTQFLHIFEMPLVGYGGYVPFALELFELKNILWRKVPRSTLSTPQTAPAALDLM